ncbi:hypothetical protein ACFSVK_15915 [Azorhizophilus paspali]|uniref:hypothetical protein n=1 Tax=Azorhizophilus paspali TaxID=69963 RepID=UPI0036324EEA
MGPGFIGRLEGTSKNVGEAVSARQKQAKKRSLRAVNEHFELVFNAAMTTQVVFRGALEELECQGYRDKKVHEVLKRQQAEEKHAPEKRVDIMAGACPAGLDRGGGDTIKSNKENIGLSIE